MNNGDLNSIIQQIQKKLEQKYARDFVIGEVLEDEGRLRHDPDGRQHSSGTLFTKSEQRDDRYRRKAAAWLLEAGFSFRRH